MHCAALKEGEGMQQPQGPFCQSCAMPLQKEEDFGTNADGSKSEEYCRYCYQAGKFTEPDISMKEMVDKVVSFLVSLEKMPEAQAREIGTTFIPQLKRWRE